jgi:hypothetical protein
LRLPDGTLLATHDYFGLGCPHNHEGMEHLTSVYRSHDQGRTWHNVTHISGAFWGGLFLLGSTVYLLSTSAQYGAIVIRRSDDGGSTWTHPTDGRSGLLFPGGPGRQPPNYHCAPVPVLIHQGRLYRAFEDCDPCVWGSGFQALVISAPVDADLLDARSWTMSTKLAYDPAWTPAAWSAVLTPGWLEGNMVADPDGALWDVLRVNSEPAVDKGAMVAVSPDGSTIRFAPATGFVDLPGGMTKFTIRRDPHTGQYLTLVNNNTDPTQPRQRNILSLAASSDLRHWRLVTTLLADDSELAWPESVRLTGFQYVDWQFDGDDLIYLVRTAYNGAHSYHDSNRITFHRLRQYATLF